MNKLDEISKAYIEYAKHKAEFPDRSDVFEAGYKAALAELSKDAEPATWTTKSMIGTSTMQDENYPVPLFTRPANAAENATLRDKVKVLTDALEHYVPDTPHGNTVAEKALATVKDQ